MDPEARQVEAMGVARPSEVLSLDTPKEVKHQKKGRLHWVLAGCLPVGLSLGWLVRLASILPTLTARDFLRAHKTLNAPGFFLPISKTRPGSDSPHPDKRQPPQKCSAKSICATDPTARSYAFSHSAILYILSAHSLI